MREGNRRRDGCPNCVSRCCYGIYPVWQFSGHRNSCDIRETPYGDELFCNIARSFGCVGWFYNAAFKGQLCFYLWVPFPQPNPPQTCCNLSILPACCNSSVSYNNLLESGLLQLIMICRLVTYNLLKQCTAGL